MRRVCVCVCVCVCQDTTTYNADKLGGEGKDLGAEAAALAHPLAGPVMSEHSRRGNTAVSGDCPACSRHSGRGSTRESHKAQTTTPLLLGCGPKATTRGRMVSMGRNGFPVQSRLASEREREAESARDDGSDAWQPD